MNTTENEYSNVVSIGSLGTERITEISVKDDPLEELVPSDILDDEDEYEEEKIQELSYRDFSSFNSTGELLEHLRDIQNRIHYYVDEIETNIAKSKS